MPEHSNERANDSFDGVMVGILARIDGRCREATEHRLQAIPNVSTFAVPGDGQLGILLERESVDAALETLQRSIETLPGVLGCWPVFQYDGTAEDGTTKDSTNKEHSQ